MRRAEASRAPVGTGPFKFVSWRRNEELVIERNPAYWGEKPHLDRIRFKFVRDREVAWELYHRGEIDLLWQVPPSHFDEARNDPKLSGHRLLANFLSLAGLPVQGAAAGDRPTTDPPPA